MRRGMTVGAVSGNLMQQECNVLTNSWRYLLVSSWVEGDPELPPEPSPLTRALVLLISWWKVNKKMWLVMPLRKYGRGPKYETQMVMNTNSNTRTETIQILSKIVTLVFTEYSLSLVLPSWTFYYWYSDHLNTEHLKNEHSKFRKLLVSGIQMVKVAKFFFQFKNQFQMPFEYLTFSIQYYNTIWIPDKLSGTVGARIPNEFGR